MDFNQNIIISLIVSLLVTIIIELIVARLFGFRKKHELLVVVLINLITNPVLNYLILLKNYTATNYQTEAFSPFVVVLEIIIVIIEWLLLRFALNNKSTKLFLFSLVANACSFLMPVISGYLLGYI